MPFQSEKQRRFMYAKHPEIAKRWTEEYGSEIGGDHEKKSKKKAKKSTEGLKKAYKGKD